MNPYQVLGVRETATADEIKTAYRNLVKKYHPDKYTDPAMKELAEEKIKQINEAYDMLTKNANGSTAHSYQSRSYSGSYSGEGAFEFTRVESFINSGNFAAATQILDSMSIRNARWNYLYGVVALRTNRFDAAANFFETAYRMEPNNIEYIKAYNMTHMNGHTYRTNSGNVTTNDCGCFGCDDDCCTIFTSVLCANMMCDCCCR